MSSAAKGKALVVLVLFAGLFAAVTFIPGFGSDAARDGRGGAAGGEGQARAPESAAVNLSANPSANPSAAPSPSAPERAETEPAKPAEADASREDAPREDAPAPTAPADAGDGARPVSDARPAPGSEGGEGALSSVERGRAEQAASQYVVYAYGYTGDDVDQYRSYVNQAVVPESFRKSPGAAQVEAFARKVEATGTESSVIPKSVEVRAGARPGEATARVTFELTDPSGRTLVSQDSRVVALGDVWRVAYAGELEEVGG